MRAAWPFVMGCERMGSLATSFQSIYPRGALISIWWKMCWRVGGETYILEALLPEDGEEESRHLVVVGGHCGVLEAGL